MAVPTELLRLAETHACFSGCYAAGNRSFCLFDRTVAPEMAIDIQCEDCLTFRLGGLASAFASGMTPYVLASEVTAHLRLHRGYALSFGGYHTQGGGFWLSAAYWSTIGVFVLKSDRGLRSRQTSDVDLLVQAFSTGVATPTEPGMLHTNQYAAHRVFLNILSLPPLTSAQALLSSPHVSPTPKRGFTEVTLAEYLPVSRRSSTVSKRSTGTITPTFGSSRTAAGIIPRAPIRSPQLGDRCGACGEVMGERWLLTSRYVGCGCE